MAKVKGKQLTYEELRKLPLGTEVWCELSSTIKDPIGMRAIIKKFKSAVELKRREGGFVVIDKLDTDYRVYECVEVEDSKEQVIVCAADVFKLVTDLMCSTYKAKNSDYGSSFSKTRKEFGNAAILIRLTDKLERLKTLMSGNEQQVKDESINDTLLDLANYAVMELVERKISNKEEVK
jgi:hypothetical protein